MTYEEWEMAVAGVIKSDSSWKMTAYWLVYFVSSSYCWSPSPHNANAH
ncbi:MAG: hypothetical protein P8186_14060 [Anaerolineae bacterium]|jgi:hypothetical protein